LRKFSKKLLFAFMLTVILVLSVAGSVLAAEPHYGDCPNDSACQNDCVCPCSGDPNDGACQNDGACPCDGDGPADGTGLQIRTQANTASSCQNQYNNQFKANGNCNANQYSKAYRNGYGLTPD
jgi:hypothetical protein